MWYWTLFPLLVRCHYFRRYFKLHAVIQLVLGITVPSFQESSQISIVACNLLRHSMGAVHSQKVLGLICFYSNNLTALLCLLVVAILRILLYLGLDESSNSSFILVSTSCPISQFLVRYFEPTCVVYVTQTRSLLVSTVRHRFSIVLCRTKTSLQRA